MQFTTRVLFIAIAVFAVWLGFIAQGNDHFGPVGGAAFGYFSGIEIALLAWCCWSWKGWTEGERAFYSAILALPLLGMVLFVFAF